MYPTCVQADRPLRLAWLKRAKKHWCMQKVLLFRRHVLKASLRVKSVNGRTRWLMVSAWKASIHCGWAGWLQTLLLPSAYAPPWHEGMHREVCWWAARQSLLAASPLESQAQRGWGWGGGPCYRSGRCVCACGVPVCEGMWWCAADAQCCHVRCLFCCHSVDPFTPLAGFHGSSHRHKCGSPGESGMPSLALTRHQCTCAVTSKVLVPAQGHQCLT